METRKKALTISDAQERELVGMLQDLSENQLAALRDPLKSIINQGEPTPAATAGEPRQIGLEL